MPETGATNGSGSGPHRDQEDAVLAAERAFAIRVAYDGIRSAFLSVLAADAIVLRDGPVSGRAAFAALPKDHAGRLLWEPSLAVASPDGTLAGTAGPYRLLDGKGAEQEGGAYFSVWRQVPGSGVLELVLDFGIPGAALPEDGVPALGPEDPGAPACDLKPFTDGCLREGWVPSGEGALCLGPGPQGGALRPQGCFLSRDGRLGVLWGARDRQDGSRGAFALLLRAARERPEALLLVQA